MPFKRIWNSSCPRYYNAWETDGVSWVIQDLDPKDDEQAMHLLVNHLIPDETLCMACDLVKSKISVESMAYYWRVCLAERTSLACYAKKDGQTILAAVNCCVVRCRDEDTNICEIEGEEWQNVYNALSYVESQENSFDYLGVNTLLYAMGLVVRRDFRGARLGTKVLSAREQLCQALGIKGTSTVFTGVASQMSAERAGFITIANVTLSELADSGLDYPRNDTVIKLMVKKFGS